MMSNIIMKMKAKAWLKRMFSYHFFAYAPFVILFAAEQICMIIFIIMNMRGAN